MYAKMSQVPAIDWHPFPIWINFGCFPRRSTRSLVSFQIGLMDYVALCVRCDGASLLHPSCLITEIMDLCAMCVENLRSQWHKKGSIILRIHSKKSSQWVRADASAESHPLIHAPRRACDCFVFAHSHTRSRRHFIAEALKMKMNTNERTRKKIPFTFYLIWICIHRLIIY